MMISSYLMVIFIGGVFGLLGSIFLIVALVNRRKSQNAASWPVAPGAIVASRVEEQQDFDPENGISTARYRPVVEYQYPVLGQNLTGRRIAFGTGLYDQKTAERIASAYVPGSYVQVYYNPQNPSDSVLQPKPGGSKVFLILGIVFLVLAVTGCCVSLVLAALV